MKNGRQDSRRSSDNRPSGFCGGSSEYREDHGQEMKLLNLVCKKCGHRGLLIREVLLIAVIALCQKCRERHYLEKDEIEDYLETD